MKNDWSWWGALFGLVTGFFIELVAWENRWIGGSDMALWYFAIPVFMVIFFGKVLKW